ncbi:hypothetical protein CC86DRAFT_428771 [Ophiobolus disseminans]|uniref:Fatty acid hydroxylase domain-containing protein n=1 Tax=Ophiobolus disseminans TaxID=1469910 RepID=A0A6A6ZH79_9PLEO|nr:hypothetical protein CC86DRAFT_428771 [Ophiobolus disseminans]
MANLTSILPLLPSYDLQVAPSILSFVSDKTLSLLAVPVSYIILSLFWEFIDSHTFWDAYKIHPSEEVLSRNRVSKWETLRGVFVYHAVSLAAAVALTWNDDCVSWQGKEAFDVAVWAQRLRRAQAAIPFFLEIVGVDSVSWAGDSGSMVAGLLRGGLYPTLTETKFTSDGPLLHTQFAQWELDLARTIYYVVVPVIQFYVALFIADTWFYFMHRLFHTNKFLYKHFHAIHHRLYVVYAFGAVYAHPIEGLVVDFTAFTLGITIAQLTVRQAILFNVLTVWKAMSDHCGYVLPWDPFVYLTANTSKYHDVHHQMWGLKNNFAVFFGFWDRVMGTERLVPPPMAEKQMKKQL